MEIFRSLLFIAFITLIMTSCDEGAVYHKKYSLEKNTWSYNESFEFQTDIIDTSLKYDLIIEAKILKEYPYQNLYLTLGNYQANERIFHDTININLINNKGLWLGDCSKNSCNFSLPVQTSYAFSKSGHYSFKLEQFTRDKDLQGIEEIGFSIKKSNASK